MIRLETSKRNGIDNHQNRQISHFDRNWARDLLKIAPQVRQYVIVNRKGKPYSRDGFQTQSKRAMTKAFPDKADRFTSHDIRAKSLLDAGSLEQARTRAGHADSKIT